MSPTPVERIMKALEGLSEAEQQAFLASLVRPRPARQRATVEPRPIPESRRETVITSEIEWV